MNNIVITNNGAVLNPKHFVVQVSNLDEFYRSYLASKEFINLCGFILEEFEDKYDNYGFTFSSTNNSVGLLEKTSSGFVFRIKNSYIEYDLFSCLCIIHLDDTELNTINPIYFIQQDVTALARFIGQGLLLDEVQNIQGDTGYGIVLKELSIYDDGSGHAFIKNDDCFSVNLSYS